ncbi:MAG: hypothetical protein R6V62_05790 [Candidatus Fermentibacteraceae bacterium]
MIFLACILLSTGSDAIWLLRAGFDAGSTSSHSTNVHVYQNTGGRVPEDPSKLPLETSLLIWNGDPYGASVQWMIGGRDVPATRNDLLGAMVWFGRSLLTTHLGLGYTPPADMVDSRYPTHSAVVLQLGWMAGMPDGLFHPEFRLGRADLKLLGLPDASAAHAGRSAIDAPVEAMFR